METRCKANGSGLGVGANNLLLKGELLLGVSSRLVFGLSSHHRPLGLKETLSMVLKVTDFTPEYLLG